MTGSAATISLPKPNFSGAIPKAIPINCVKKMIGNLKSAAEVAVDAALVGVEVQLAHRAHAEDHVGARVDGALQQPADQLERLRFADLRHVAAAAVGLDRVIDDLRPEPGEQVVHFHRVLRVVHVAHRPHPLAAVVGGDAQAGQRLHDLLADGRLANVAVDHVEQVPHEDAARPVGEPAGRQAGVHPPVHLRAVAHQLVGLLQVEEAGGARGDQPIDLLVDQRQVARDHRAGGQFVLRKILRRPAAVPVVDLLQFDRQHAGDDADARCRRRRC